MGIKNLNKMIKKYCKNSVKTIELTELTGEIVSIDTSIFLYKYQYNNAHYLLSFLKQIIKLLESGIIPFYVFDGKPPKEKNGTLMDRLSKKEQQYTKVELLKAIKNNVEIDVKKFVNKRIDKENVEKIYKELLKTHVNGEDIDAKIRNEKKKIIRVKKKHITDLMKLLDIMGIPYIKATNEAEIVCAQLSRNNIVCGCITEDSDYLTNSGDCLLRNFNFNNNTIIKYDYYKLIEELGLTKEQFVDFCILCGCDYTGKITGIGPIRAIQLIKQYKNIEKIVELINKGSTKYKVQDNFDYISSRKIFEGNIYSDEELETIKQDIILKTPNIDECIAFLDENCIVLSNQFKRQLEKLNKKRKKVLYKKQKDDSKKQQFLTNYFSTK
tara:strand:- start:1502 stop:2650 length:1149 start_codon:yes stop_codon:yes gene_type:complete